MFQKRKLFIKITIILVTQMISLSAAPDQKIKKGTQLNCPKDGLLLVAAQKIHTNGKGHGIGSSLLIAGLAVGQGMNQAQQERTNAQMAKIPGTTPVNYPAPANPADATQEQEQADPDLAEYDSTRSLWIAAGSSCRVPLGIKLIVIGQDGSRVLLEVRDLPYGGPQHSAGYAPVMSGGAVDFGPAVVSPTCLDKTKLWVDQDSFLGLQTMPTALTPAERAHQRKQKQQEEKAAVRRATGQN